MPGNQQGVPLSPPAPLRNPEGWWGYCPTRYAVASEPTDEADEHSFPSYTYPRYPDGDGAYIGREPFRPLYDRNFTSDLARTKITRRDYLSDRRRDREEAAAYSRLPDSDCPQRRSRLDVNNGCDTVLPSEINHLDAQPWSEISNCRYASENGNDDQRCVITTMNIVEEEEEEEGGVPDGTNDSSGNVEGRLEKTKGRFGPHVNVPNYTYIDTSDSSESDDPSDSTSDDENLLDSRRQNFSRSNGTTSNNTSSDSDSDSYVAYSAVVNSQRLEGDSQRAAEGDGIAARSADADNREPPTSNAEIDEQTRSERELDDLNSRPYTLEEGGERVATKERIDQDYTDDRNNFDPTPADEAESRRTDDRDSDADRERRVENPTIAATIPYRLSVIYEDAERPDPESPCRDDDERNGASLETATTDDDIVTTVSVSLPLRFKFSVSENNQDITTVIVGDSKIKAERSRGTEGGYSAREGDDKVDNVSVDFQVGNDISADFTVKGRVADANETASATTRIPHTVNFTLRREPATRENGTGCEEKRAKVDLAMAIGDDRVVVVSESPAMKDETTTVAPKVTASEVARVVDARSSNGDDRADRINRAIARDTDVEPEMCSKRPSSVQDSRENTDDEDSGVTSDTSRMISEVDTDSECASARNMRKYQRTQTHSRLFRLLNDDSVLSECPKTDPPLRKEYLSLPLEANVFSYDDSYCSNYSSGLTSPEYSPIYEQSWRRFHDATNAASAAIDRPSASRLETASNKDDSYFRTWKNSRSPGTNEHEVVVPSLALKILDSKLPPWAYKVNVLCPRIKSTKNVPQALSRGCAQTPRVVGKANDPLVFPSVPTSRANAKTNYC